MQVAFVENLMRMRCENVERVLLLSSTGTGKTLASVFALRVVLVYKCGQEKLNIL